MKYRIDGTTMQVLHVELTPGDEVYTEVGGMAWMSDNIEMDTETKGGVLSGIGRMMAGESFFVNRYHVNEGQGTIAFAAEYPGSIVPIELKKGESRICQKDAFMCAEGNVKLEKHFQKKLGAGMFGGEGFILQKLTGPGMAFVDLSGEIIEMELDAGQRLKVDTGYIAMFEPQVKFDITRVKGVKNMLFGGEGVFLAILEGPGKVWLQSMPIQTLAARLSRFLTLKRR